MDLKKLFKIQKEFNDTIVFEHNLEKEDLKNKTFLALLSELGELSRQTRCFSYWSDETELNKAKILDEYVDCLHFILTLGLDNGYKKVNINHKEDISVDLSQLFINLYVGINELVICASLDSYEELFQDFIALGKRLGFTKEEIFEGYINKNRENSAAYIMHKKKISNKVKINRS